MTPEKKEKAWLMVYNDALLARKTISKKRYFHVKLAIMNIIIWLIKLRI